MYMKNIDIKKLEQQYREGNLEVDMEKLKEYLSEDEDIIIEFKNDQECLEYFNTYDFQNYQSIDEMKEDHIYYGFNVGEKRYFINFEEGFDVYKGI